MLTGNRKPERWGFDKGLVAPEWGWWHDALVDAWPIWGSQIVADAGNDVYFERNLGGKFGNKLHRWHSDESLSDSARVIDKFGAALRVGDGTGANQAEDRWVISENIADFTPGSEGSVAIFYRVTDHASSRDFVTALGEDSANGGGAAFISWFLGSNTSPFSQRFGVLQSTSAFIATGNNLVVGNDTFEVGTWKIGGRVKLYQDGLETGDAAAPTSGSLNFDSSWKAKLGTINLDGINSPQFICHLVAIIDRELTASQIAQWYADLFGPFTMADEAGVVFAVAAAGGDGTDIPWPLPAVPPRSPIQVVGY